MKTRKLLSVPFVVALLLALTLGLAQAQAPTGAGDQQVAATSLGTAFTYQGQLKDNGAPAQGTYRLQFSLWDAAQNGNAVGTSDTQNVSATKGLFTVMLNATDQFGANAFSGDARWLEIRVCPTNPQISCGTLGTTLSPRQPLTATPYALGLRPGAHIRGSAYQVVKIESDAATGSTPAAVTGEMMSALDGVGVYGSNNSTAANSAGVGVWGRSYNLAGAGVLGTGLNGSVGVHGTSTADSGVLGSSTATAQSAACVLWPPLCAGVQGDGVLNGVAGNSATGAGVFGNSSSGTALRLWTNTGELIRAYTGSAGSAGDLRFRVDNVGNVYADGQYKSPAGDFAEMLPAAAGLEPGDVLVIGAGGQLERSTTPYQTSVAGIYSTKPGFVGGSGTVDKAADGAPLAISGVVPVKAVAENGPIHAGDLLTTSSAAGYAMKASPLVVDGARLYPTGTIIGKALGNLESGRGAIRCLVTLQ